MANKEANSGAATGGDYDVFLSFRGPDTRNTFADFLYVLMKIRGLRVFRDDEELRPGEKISEILRAVQSSRIYIPIFSKNYASSKWCLRELTHMVECYGQSPWKQILPIFFDVDPSDVKLETELYKNALTNHEEDLGCTEVKHWKEALTTVARIKGWHIKDKRQGEVTEDIVKEVLQKINTTKRDLPAHLVGIDDRVEDIKRLLNCYDTDDVRFVIIHGIGGMGKTTLANAVFNQLSPQFEGHSFLSNIQDLGIENIQKKLVADLFHFSLSETFDFEEGNNLIRKMLPNKQVLLVFDGMDENDQSMHLAKYCTLCGLGSRIIITTTNKSVFSMVKVEGFEENISTRSTEIIPYEMKEMHLDHALQFFNKLAFNTDSAPSDLYDLSKEVVELTGGLPLAVEVIGSHLCGQSKAQWISTLNKLKKVPHEKVQQRLKISYDALEYRQQQIFLDIACFFVNKKKTNPIYMWEDLGFHPGVEIKVLIDKSLIKIVDHDRIWMHDQLRALGREIICQEHMRKPEDQSRSWFLEVLHEKLSGDIITKKWSTWVKIMVASKLKVLKIGGSKPLIKTPCFSEFMSLERLVLKDFPNLVQIDPSIGSLERLIYLKVKWCPCLEGLPQQIGHLIALKELILIQGFSICNLPDSIGNLRLLLRLVVENTGLVELPNTIKGLVNLEYLCLANCTSLNLLSDVVGELKSLTELDLSGTTIEELPHSIYSLENLTLWISSSKIRTRLMKDLPPLEGIEDCLESMTLTTNWKRAPKDLKEVPLEKVQQKLLLIYEALEYGLRQIFLDIASFFINKKETDVVYMWKDYDLFPRVEIDALVNKSLIKILDHEQIWMHDQVRDFGRKIIRQENIEKPRDQSNLQFLKVAPEELKLRSPMEGQMLMSPRPRVICTREVKSGNDRCPMAGVHSPTIKHLTSGDRRRVAEVRSLVQEFDDWWREVEVRIRHRALESSDRWRAAEVHSPTPESSD